jgi:putative FmdB family regulatory protein
VPIFEYACEDCGNSFEVLVRSDSRVACPSCGSENARKKLSLFASVVKKDGAEAPSCHTGHHGCDLGKCGSGFCGVE